VVLLLLLACCCYCCCLWTQRKLSHLRRKLWREAGPPPDLATRLFSERIIYLVRARHCHTASQSTTTWGPYSPYQALSAVQNCQSFSSRSEMRNVLLAVLQGLAAARLPQLH